MNLRDLQAGRGGWRTLPARAFLRILSWGYALGSGARNVLYRVGVLRARRLPVPVISVGNLAVGGTGKSPTIAWLCEHLLARGERVGVLSRGYGAVGEELNDEGLELRARFGLRGTENEVVQAQGPRRFDVGKELLDRHPDLTVLLLDDGFQHRALHRDLDVVLLEARNPFSYGHLLPRGRLREPTRALARADVIVLSKCEGVDSASLDGHQRKIAAHTRAPIVHSEMSVAGVDTADGSIPPSRLRGARVALLCGVGNPAHVRATTESLGAHVVSMHTVGDHRPISQHALARAVEAVNAGTLDFVVITMKDAVKLPALPEGVCVLRIITIMTRGAEDLVSSIERVLPS